MAERPQDSKAQEGGGTAEGAAATRSGAERGGEAAGRGTAASMRRAGESGGEVTRQAGAPMSAEMRHFRETPPETAQAGARGLAEGEQGLARNAAAQWEETSQHIVSAMQDAAREIRALFAIPGASQDALQDMRAGVGGLMEGMLRTNMRLAQEMFRMVSPAATIDLQRRFAAEYLDTMMQGTTMLLRATRRTADDTLRPFEERAEQRRFGATMAGGLSRAQPRECVADVMETEVRMASPEDTVQQAAQMMREADAGALPVGDGERLVGMVTDRDVALRLVAEGRDPRQTRVREVMTPEVRYVYADEDLDHVADNMAEQQVRRLPVVNRNKRLVGVISLADLARHGRSERVGRAYRGIVRARGLHSQAAE